ncbi:serine/threonine-protein kinase Nek4-like isoform X1 [Rhopilema esculentum]|uniref:serine/threonine-protein kinase Nek4-like isoform X1 n=1 Tax=Rhopilema esculentum TaxID=499914 RepID=UPI0031D5C675
MPLESYTLGKLIGKGSYGQVSLARHKRDKKQYVIKKIDLHEASDKERLFAQQEVQILSKLKHPNIVSYKESFQSGDGFLHIVMGYCEGGDLYSKLKEQAKQNELLGERQIVEWFVQIAMALQYMHDRNILHRDLKTQNIFLTKSKIIKVGDLGIARVLESTSDMATTLIGTPYYMSPELFSNKPYNHRSDVWALGCCVYEMTTLKHAFNARDMNALVYKILKGKTPPMPKQYSDELNGIIKSMLMNDPADRPSASKILRHPYVKKHIALFLEGKKPRNSDKEKIKKKVDSKVTSQPDAAEENPAAIATASGIDLDIVNDDRKNDYVVKGSENDAKSHEQFEEERPVEKEISEKKPEKVQKGPTFPSHEREETAQERVKAEPRGEKAQPKKIQRVLSADNKDEDQRKRRSHKGRKQSGSHSNSPFEKPIQVKNPRPLPPRPGAEGDWEKRGRSLTDPGDKDSDHPEQVKLPKPSVGVPNESARQRRRMKMAGEGYPHPPVVRKSSSQSHSVSASRDSENAHGSRKKVSGKKAAAVDESDSVDGIPGNNSSDGDDSGNEADVDQRRKVSRDSASIVSEQSGGDITELIGTMQATLNMDVRPLSGRSSTSSPEGVSESSSFEAENEHPSLSHTVSGRLNDRIERLRRECIRGVGEELLRKAFQILEKEEDDLESAFIALMGLEKFELYGDAIQQLKFCEEFAKRSI